MYTALLWYLTLMLMVRVKLIVLAVSLTYLYYRDIKDPAYEMIIWCFQILPVYISPDGNRNALHLLRTCPTRILWYIYWLALDGVISAAGFAALLILGVGIKIVCITKVLKEIVNALFVLIYACYKTKGPGILGN